MALNSSVNTAHLGAAADVAFTKRIFPNIIVSPTDLFLSTFLQLLHGGIQKVSLGMYRNLFPLDLPWGLLPSVAVVILPMQICPKLSLM